MINLGVIFGSRTAEHDVSVVSGLQILENADRAKYNAFPIYIDKNGCWYIGEPLRNVKTYSGFDPEMKGIKRVILPPVPGINGLLGEKEAGLFSKAGTQIAQKLDCCILAMHGMHGEDGTVQGLLELADIPYSSCGVTGSAAGMDKIIMKAVFKSMGLPVLDSIDFYRTQWRCDSESIIGQAEALGYPLYVKPANLGSSIGIGRAADRQGLVAAIEVACMFDRRILVEKGIDKPTEINCACIGFDSAATPSMCEQPVSWQEFLTFEDKYIRKGEKSAGMKSLQRQIPAPISDDLTKTIQDYTVSIFNKFECKGVVRIDYMLDASGQVFVNEINTIPGSFAFYLFEPMGISFKQLIDKLVEYAFKALEQKKESTFAYSSQILNSAFGGKIKK